ncbi:MAG: DUF3667 domain-containing protein [Steroidobacteraceae bacterium]|jgi:hypothetical protein|nr:DUF3667 domain-containing protein [Steroidobacteraceae bacterium]
MPPDPPAKTQDEAAPAVGTESSLPAVAAVPPPAMPACQNCDAPLSGPYCAQCGQLADVRVATMAEVAHDFVHSFLHLDGRAWRTFRSLLLRPGELTNEFIGGRRQRYLPPFRLYLVVSLAFFALSALLPGAEAVRVDPEIGEALEAGSRCDIRVGAAGFERLDALLADACRKLAADGGKRLAPTFLAAVPKLMFVFLPLMAAVAMLFYWRPRRLYAEHLVLFLHMHALVFLVLSVNAVLNALQAAGVPGAGILGAAGAALLLYIPYYVYRAMRVVYGDGRARTLMKFAVLGTLYSVLLGLTLLAGVVYSLLSL